jgi:hypothetical protein
MIEVLDGGLQTTIQDGGRPGFLSRGIPPAGAQDFYSLAIANFLVGNALTLVHGRRRECHSRHEHCHQGLRRRS